MIEDDHKLAQLDAEMTAAIVRYLNDGGTIERAYEIIAEMAARREGDKRRHRPFDPLED